MMNNNDIIYILIVTVSAIVACIYIKKYALTDNIEYMFIAIPIYIISIIAYIKMFKSIDVSTALPFINILQIIMIVVGGIIFFDESINNKKMIGIALGSTSCYLLCT